MNWKSKVTNVLLTSSPSAGLRGFLLAEWGVLLVLVAGAFFDCGRCGSCRKYTVQCWTAAHGFKWLKVSKKYFYWWTTPTTFWREAKLQSLKQLFQKKWRSQDMGLCMPSKTMAQSAGSKWRSGRVCPGVVERIVVSQRCIHPSPWTLWCYLIWQKELIDTVI